jgi:hypothetical protein
MIENKGRRPLTCHWNLVAWLNNALFCSASQWFVTPKSFFSNPNGGVMVFVHGQYEVGLNAMPPFPKVPPNSARSLQGRPVPIARMTYAKSRFVFKNNKPVAAEATIQARANHQCRWRTHGSAPSFQVPVPGLRKGPWQLGRRHDDHAAAMSGAPMRGKKLDRRGDW